MSKGPEQGASALSGRSGTETWTLPGDRAKAPRHGPVTIFAPGEVLDGRFKILRFLGQGGMGQVFEAQDLELGARVALKVIRPELSRSPRAIERFKQEVHLARQVTHPNVCRIFDLFQHRFSKGWGKEEHPILFVTMEMLDGETLAEHLRRTGPLAPEQALEVIQGLAQGLDAAHRAGVLHLDFKSSNVLLLDDPDGRRAVVTDFGLAQSRDVLSGPVRAGTPAYLAPELVAGETATAATDIYSLGVVIFEILTGRLPFRGADAKETALLRLQQEAPSPRQYRPDIPQAWERAVMRCLERSPEARFATASELVESLAPPPPPQPEQRALSRIALAGLVGTLLIFSSFLPAWLSESPSPPLGTPTAEALPNRPDGNPREARTAVALLGLKHLAPQSESAWVATALEEMLTTELALASSLRPLAGEKVVRMKDDLDIDEAHELSVETLERVHHYLQADFVASGSCLPLEDGRLRFDLRVQDVVTGETVLTHSEEGETAKLFELVSRMGATLRSHFGATAPSLSPELASGLPTNAESSRLYAQGLQLLRDYELPQACHQLTLALNDSPTSAAIHSALADCWGKRGYASQAETSAYRAFQLSKNLGDEPRRLLEARYAEAAHNWSRAQELYRALWTVFPDTLDYGLRLALVEAKGGLPENGFAIVEQVRQGFGDRELPPEVDLVEAKIAWHRGDLGRQQQAAARAVHTGRALGADLLVARARLLEAQALDRMGLQQETQEALEEIQEIYEIRGDQRGWAWALLSFQGGGSPRLQPRFGLDFKEALQIFRDTQDSWGEALALARQARLATNRHETDQPIEEWLNQALELSRQLGNRMVEAEILNHRGVFLEVLGDERAVEVFAQAEETARSSGNLLLEHRTLGNRAVSLMNQRRFRESRPLLDRAVILSRSISSRADQGALLLNLAHAHMTAGEMTKGQEVLQEAWQISQEIAHPVLETTAIRLQADFDFCHGQAKKALETLRHLHQSELPLWLDDPLDLAFHLLAESPNEALALLRDLDPPQDPHNLTEKEVWRFQLLAWSLLEQGLTQAAREVLNPLRPVLAGTRRTGVRQMGQLLLARLDATPGSLDPALDTVTLVGQQAWEEGDLVTYLYAHFHGVRLLEETQEDQLAQAALARLDQEAETIGCPGIAQWARRGEAPPKSEILL